MPYFTDRDGTRWEIDSDGRIRRSDDIATELFGKLLGWIIGALVFIAAALLGALITLLWNGMKWIHQELTNRYGGNAIVFEIIGYSAVVLVVSSFLAMVVFISGLNRPTPIYAPVVLNTPTSRRMPISLPTTPIARAVTVSSATPTHVATSTSPSTVNASTLILRDGPDTNSGVVDRLPQGTAVTIIARTASSEWFQIVVPSRSKQGWVAARYIDTRVALDSIPIASSTPPTRAIPANTATPPPPAGVRINYYAEQETLARGACTVLHWGIENVQALYLNSEGVQGWDEKRVCPNTTTTYTMRIVLLDGRAMERNIVVRVQ